MVNTELQSATERHTGSWAIERLARTCGVEICEATLFGLGRAAWCGMFETATGSVFATTHPESVPRMMMALNIPCERFVFRTNRALSARDLNSGILIAIDPSALENRGALRMDPNLPKLYHVWLERVHPREGSEWPEVGIRVMDQEELLCMDGSQLAAAWLTPSRAGMAFLYYINYSQKAFWHPHTSIQLAIQLWVHQMREQKSPWGIAGLAALNAYATLLEKRSGADHEFTRRYAALHGGQSGYRNQLSEFLFIASQLFEASQLFKSRVLDHAGNLCRESASKWREVLGDDYTDHGKAACALRSVSKLEHEVIDLLGMEFCR